MRPAEERIGDVRKEYRQRRKQLSNPGFLAKAPTNVVEGLRKQKTENESLRDKSRKKWDELGCK